MAAPTRVQATGRVRATSTTTVAMTFAATPTAGNTIVVTAIIFGTNTAATVTCADNKGNPYGQAAYQTNGSLTAVVFACAAALVTGSSFTVTITAAAGSYFEADAIEVTGVGTAGYLSLDQTVTQTGTAAAVSTGTTPALLGTDVFVVAAHAIGANQASLTVQSVSPAWFEEFENLSYSTTIAGEVDSRSLTSVLGTTQTCSWTAATSAAYAALLVVFMPTVAGTGALARVQATPQTTATSGTTVTVTFSATPTVGNGVIVAVVAADTTAISVADNRGNAYTLVTSQTQPSLPSRVFLYACPALTATGAPLSVTATGSSSVARMAVAIEVTGALVVDQTTGGIGVFPTAPTTGLTPALGAARAFVVAIVGTSSSVITVNATLPAWTQEAEEVTAASAHGEVDSRLVLSTAPQSALWTLSGANYWAAALATFTAGAVAAVGRSQAFIVVP